MKMDKQLTFGERQNIIGERETKHDEVECYGHSTVE